MKLHPDELTLEPRQVAELEAWVVEVVRPYREEVARIRQDAAWDDEECVPTSPITFHLYITGLGTVINTSAYGGRFSCNLSIDDDNELIRDWKDVVTKQ